MLGLGCGLQGLHQADRQVVWDRALFLLATSHANEDGALQFRTALHGVMLREARQCSG